MMDTLRHLARHYMHVSYHVLHRIGAPRALIPNLFLALVAVGLTLWLVTLGLVGRQAQRKGQSFWYGFLFALISTPIVASLYVAFLRPLKATRKTTRRRPAFAAESRGRDRERVA